MFQVFLVWWVALDGVRRRRVLGIVRGQKEGSAVIHNLIFKLITPTSRTGFGRGTVVRSYMGAKPKPVTY